MAGFHEQVFKHTNFYLSRESANVSFGRAPLRTWRLESVVQYDAQERSVDLKTAVVFDKTELPELVHEKIDS
jgi:hypothetical protein